LKEIEEAPVDRHLARARSRNVARLKLANKKDEEILGKYLPD
jgi:hypothetical protein